MMKYSFSTIFLLISFLASAQFGASLGYGGFRLKAKSGGIQTEATVNNVDIGVWYLEENNQTLKSEALINLGLYEDDGGEVIEAGYNLRYFPKTLPGLSISAGTLLGFVLEDSVEDLTNFSWSFGPGVGLDFNRFFARTNILFQLNNTYTGSEDFKIKGSGYTISFGYRF